MPRNEAKQIIIHHTGDKSMAPQFKKVEAWHEYKAFPISSLGFYCGYHFLIEKNGLVINARRLEDEGAHTKGHNFESIGIGLAGNFDFEIPTIEQLNALDKLAAEITLTLKNPNMIVKYHWDFADTHCPGYYFTTGKWYLKLVGIKLGIIEKFLLWLLNFIRK